MHRRLFLLGAPAIVAASSLMALPVRRAIVPDYCVQLYGAVLKPAVVLDFERNVFMRHRMVMYAFDIGEEGAMYLTKETLIQ